MKKTIDLRYGRVVSWKLVFEIVHHYFTRPRLFPRQSQPCSCSCCSENVQLMFCRISNHAVSVYNIFPAICRRDCGDNWTPSSVTSIERNGDYLCSLYHRLSVGSVLLARWRSRWRIDFQFHARSFCVPQNYSNVSINPFRNGGRGQRAVRMCQRNFLNHMNSFQGWCGEGSCGRTWFGRCCFSPSVYQPG